MRSTKTYMTVWKWWWWWCSRNDDDAIVMMQAIRGCIRKQKKVGCFNIKISSTPMATRITNKEMMKCQSANVTRGPGRGKIREWKKNKNKRDLDIELKKKWHPFNIHLNRDIDYLNSVFNFSNIFSCLSRYVNY